MDGLIQNPEIGDSGVAPLPRMTVLDYLKLVVFVVLVVLRTESR